MLRDLNNSLVSVVMPCFNHARYVRESVKSILAQGHSHLELIVIDDHSTDGSWDILQELAATDSRVVAIRQPVNQGVSRARNRALSIARGQFIAFCDSDDVWEPQKLKLQLRTLAHHPECGMTYSDSAIIDGEGRLTGKRFSDSYPLPANPSGFLFTELLDRNFINIQSVLLRQSVLSEMMFAEDIDWIEDWWMWLNLSRKHRWVFTSEPLARYRVHAASTNKIHARQYSINRIKVYQKALRDFSEISAAQRAELTYHIGVNLCALGKCVAGKRLFVRAIRMSILNGKVSLMLRAIARLSACAINTRRTPERGSR